MKRLLIFPLLLFAIAACGPATQKQAQEPEPTGAENIAYQWGEMALEATALDTERFNPRPTITSRYLGLIFTAVFDAWSRYDANATPVYLQGVARVPEAERTLENKEVAISYAALRAMNEYYYSDSTLFRDFMKELGLDPDNHSTDPTTPAGIGNLAAQAVIAARKGDGANQYGEEPGSEGTPYFDYSGYQPVNSPDNNTDINRWQPKYFADGKGGRYAPECLTPYWQEVAPIALDSASQFRPGPPPMVGSEQLEREVQEVIEMQANLTDADKALVEFMRDGPKSVQQAGHWLKFAQDVSRRDQHTLDQDVKMYFLNQVTAMDAFIASWDSKMFYDFARPYALVHDYYQGQVIKAWGGPGKGMMDMPGEQWRPYSPETFLCPPFPSYTSGHSTVSGACGEALRLFTGDDYFGEKVSLVPGSLTETDPAHYGDTVVLEFPTFTEAAEMAGISRVMGGYHIQADNIAGLELGRDVARRAWAFYQEHIGAEKP
ncbi:vanadium-dependent haloperoxidase [Robiginitalea sediminis]|uniref:vanadium-dependent haloperoxidase n=1 Tax=Robiginitalea sediminis TaxID=1982593 RepID=UPI000B4B32F3|nr:vanadium-dependent haloperoxidase [Robiginitalea sediminis]